jgi:hypothetical protein
MRRDSEAAEIAARRLLAHHLTGEPFASPVAAVRWLGAVQSQDFGGAKWAVAQRSVAAGDAELDRLFDQGRILRTHVLRPTWHFVLPEDVDWMLELTGPRVLSGAEGRFRQLGIDAHTVERAESAFVAALSGGRHLTRAELGQLLTATGISPEGQRLPHLIMAAELDRVIVSGPRRGKQFTYALFEERVTRSRHLAGEEALGELARRFFRSRGPARRQDFAWWSGVTLAQARVAIDAAGSALVRDTVRGVEHWQGAATAAPPSTQGVAHLLPNFDEYTVSYRDRSAILDGRAFDPRLFPFGSVLSNVVTIAGQVRGAWRRVDRSALLRLEVRLLGRMAKPERLATEAAAERLGRFLGKPVQLDWIPGR